MSGWPFTIMQYEVHKRLLYLNVIGPVCFFRVYSNFCKVNYLTKTYCLPKILPVPLQFNLQDIFSWVTYICIKHIYTNMPTWHRLRTAMWLPPNWFWSWMTCSGYLPTPSSKPWYSMPSPSVRPWRSPLSRGRAWPQTSRYTHSALITQVQLYSHIENNIYIFLTSFSLCINVDFPLLSFFLFLFPF